jgi:hypothetical protein
MPRRNRRGDERPEPVRRRPSDAPLDLQVPGSEVRFVVGEREYRCPGCDHVVRVGTQHVVVVPRDDVTARRHWHTQCWRTHLRGRRGPRG